MYVRGLSLDRVVFLAPFQILQPGQLHYNPPIGGPAGALALTDSAMSISFLSKRAPSMKRPWIYTPSVGPSLTASSPNGIT